MTDIYDSVSDGQLSVSKAKLEHPRDWVERIWAFSRV